MLTTSVNAIKRPQCSTSNNSDTSDECLTSRNSSLLASVPPKAVKMSPQTNSASSLPSKDMLSSDVGISINDLGVLNAHIDDLGEDYSMESLMPTDSMYQNMLNGWILFLYQDILTDLGSYGTTKPFQRPIHVTFRSLLRCSLDFITPVHDSFTLFVKRLTYFHFVRFFVVSVVFRSLVIV